MSSVKVVVRIRPHHPHEHSHQPRPFISTTPTTLLIAPTATANTSPVSPSSPSDPDEKGFTFDGVVDGAGNQTDVYNAVGVGCLSHAFEGFHTCLFAYGQTGSGKTYTMMGGQDEIEYGVIPRMCGDLFKRITRMKSDDDSVDVQVAVSYLEIYNEKVRDLLSPQTTTPIRPLRVREHPSFGPYVQDLSKLAVSSASQISRLLTLGNTARATGATNMNAASSRSHAVFTIYLKQLFGGKRERTSRICLVDLAGSERAGSTGASGVRLKEGASINKSLATLGKVISTLAENGGEIGRGGSGGSGRSGVYVPYRDSTLTWLLKDCLGGNSKTVMLATISPAETSYDETLSTLRYAERAKKILNRAVINEDESGKAVKLLQQEIERLRARLALYEAKGSAVVESLSPAMAPMPASLRVQVSSPEEFEGEALGEESEYLSRRMSVLSMTSFGSGPCDENDLKDRLLATEKLMEEYTAAFDVKPDLSDFRVQSPNHEVFDLDSLAESSGAVGIMAPKTVPHLLNLSSNISANNCLLYRLPIGTHSVGSNDFCDIILSGPGISNKHATLECLSNAEYTSTAQSPMLLVYLHPASESITFVNGEYVFGSVELHTGDHIVFGETTLFRFVNPIEPIIKTQSSRGSVSADGFYSSSITSAHNGFRLSGQSFSDDRTTLSYRKSRTPSATSRQHQQVEIVQSLLEFGVRRISTLSASGRIFGQLNQNELELALAVIKKWRSRNYVCLAQDVLRNAALLKEANIIAKELFKNVFYDFEILDSFNDLTLTSFWEPGVTNCSSRSRQSSYNSLQIDSDRPLVVVKVIDGLHNSMYRWTLGEFENRLKSMRTLYDYPNSDTPSKYYEHQRVSTTELSFYGRDKESSNFFPNFHCIGLAYVDVACLLTGVLKEKRTPVVSCENGCILCWILIVLTPISVNGAAVISESAESSFRSKSLNESNSGKQGTLVFEISILELTGLPANRYTQIHCQFRMSEFKSSLKIPLGDQSLKDRVFATEPISLVGNEPVNWNFSQTVTLDVSENTFDVLNGILVRFELFAKHIPPMADVILEKFSAARLKSGGLPATFMKEEISAEKSSSHEFDESKDHIILSQFEITELSQTTGEFKPVPVQTSISTSDTLKTEFRSPADVFMIRQGIQRRISLRLSHSSGKFELPWRRISYLRIGQIRRIDLKTNRPMEDTSEFPAMVNLPVPGLSDIIEEEISSKKNLRNNPYFSSNGQASLGIEVPWDTSVHNCPYLNRPTKGFRLEMTVEWGVEIDPLDDHESKDVSQWNVFAEPVSFVKLVSVIVHERDFKVKTAAKAFDLLSSIGLGSSLKYSARSNSLFVVNTFPVSSTLMPKTQAAVDVRAVMSQIDTRFGYVRGQESLEGWCPPGQELVVEYWKRRSRRSRIIELGRTISRLEDYDGGTELKLNNHEQFQRSILAKCVDFWRLRNFGDDPNLDALLYDRKPAIMEDNTEEVQFVSSKCRLMLEMAPISFKGALMTPDVNDAWSKRYFAIRRPYLHMYSDSADLEELAIFSLVNTSVHTGNNLSGMMFLEIPFVFALHSKNCSLLLRASSDSEMQAWLAALDPLQAAVALSTKK